MGLSVWRQGIFVYIFWKNFENDVFVYIKWKNTVKCVFEQENEFFSIGALWIIGKKKCVQTRHTPIYFFPSPFNKSHRKIEVEKTTYFMDCVSSSSWSLVDREFKIERNLGMNQRLYTKQNIYPKEGNGEGKVGLSTSSVFHSHNYLQQLL